MTTEIARQNLINLIMDLDEKNPYKKQLIAIMQDYEKGTLNNIETYVLINDILVDYDFNIIMPMESKEISERRERELTKSSEMLLTDIAIQNSEDVTEVAIKTKTDIGQVFQNGYTELIKTIGIENLNMKDRKGNLITDLKKISKGKQKAKTQGIIEQYASIIDRHDIKRYAIQISDIFEIPILKELTEGRGKKGFYKDRIIPIMVKYLLFEGNINTTINKLSKSIGLVNKSFRDHEFENELKMNNKLITTKRIDKIYSYCKPEQEKIIFNTLKALQDDYSAITYIQNFLIVNTDGSTRVSTLNESILIRKVQTDVLEAFGVTRIFTIYQRGEKVKEKFYNRVCEILNDKHDFNCKAYYNQIQIYANIDKLQKLDSEFNIANEQYKILQDEVQQHFIKRIKNKIKSDYEYNQKTADIKDAKNQKEWNDNIEYKKHIPKEMQELLDIGVYNDMEVKEKVLPKPKAAYRYPENHIEVMNFLCDCFLNNI